MPVNTCKSSFEWNNGIGMTCCVGLHHDRGSVFLSDTRSNAGAVDISDFRKMFAWATSGEPVIMPIAARNLATTRAATSLLDEGTQAVSP